MDVSDPRAELAQRGALRQLHAVLPRSGSLPGDVWRRRHALVLALLVVHAAGILTLGLQQGHGRLVSALWASVILLVAALGAIPVRSRMLRSTIGAAGLIACSAILTHLSGGMTEMQFHFFVSLALITMYQEWVPFVASILFVVLHHGVVGTFAPESVYNNPAAAGAPWRWALVHSGMIAAACAVYLVQWRINEDLREDAKLLLESAGEGVLGIDVRGTIAFANPAAATILGQPREALVERPASAFFPGLHLPASGDAVRRLVHEGTTRRPDGAAIPVECILTPSVRRGSVQGHVLTFRDITERRLAEAERLAAREAQLQRMREVDQVKSQFLRNAAHELRTPLTPLGLQVELLKLRMQRDGRGDDLRALEVLRRNFARLQGLIEDILSVSRLEAGRLTLRREPVDVAAALEEVQDTFQPLADHQGIRLTVESPQGLWASADGLRLHQVLSNLVANAVRYTEQGSVSVRASVQDNEVLVAVEDTGHGLTPQQVQQLFQPFGQVHEDVAAQQLGTGLGLYISRSLVELHGGRLWVESPGPGRGSTFRFTLPIARAPPVAMVDATPASTPATAVPAKTLHT